MNADEIKEILIALNQSNGIPIQITAQTEGTQFLIITLISLISVGFICLVLWNGTLKPLVGSLYAKFLLRQMKKTLGTRILLIKHTTQGMFDSSMIDNKTLQDIEMAFTKFKSEPVSFILHTPGGVIFPAQMIMQGIVNYPNTTQAIVPLYAMSGGTLLALACNKIIMGDYASLGPIDPQLGNLFGYGSAQSWKRVVKRKGRHASDIAIQMAFIGEQYTKTIANQIRRVLTNKIQNAEQLEQAVEFLTSGNIEHGYQVTAELLSSLGIKTDKLPPEIKSKLIKIINSSMIEGVYFL